MQIYYWCPFLSKVATVDAVLNSALSVKKYSKNKINPHIINAVGEWNQFQNLIREKNIGLINFMNSNVLYKSLPRFSYLKSRFSYFLICIFSVAKLFSFLRQRNKNDIFVIHLISSLPLILIIIFNFKCKFILRISGYPKLNIFRKLLWKLCKNRISLVLCPTHDTQKNLMKQNLFSPDIYHTLYDPILDVKKICKMKKVKVPKFLENKKFILNIGRLTDQKNQIFLIKGFNKILKVFPDLYLVILGEGELDEQLKNLAKKLNIYENIIFAGFEANVFKYFNKAEFFILTSKWEDPGFVLVEAAFSRVPIISSDCQNGPKEILNDGAAGYLYKSANFDSFLNNFKKAKNETRQNLKIKRLNALKISKQYTTFRHFLSLQKVLQSIIK